jgi:hypothetical protein
MRGRKSGCGATEGAWRTSTSSTSCSAAWYVFCMSFMFLRHIQSSFVGSRLFRSLLASLHFFSLLIIPCLFNCSLPPPFFGFIPLLHLTHVLLHYATPHLTTLRDTAPHYTTRHRTLLHYATPHLTGMRSCCLSRLSNPTPLSLTSPISHHLTPSHTISHPSFTITAPGQGLAVLPELPHPTPLPSLHPSITLTPSYIPPSPTPRQDKVVLFFLNSDPLQPASEWNVYADPFSEKQV